jgi:predicted small secreted protein
MQLPRAFATTAKTTLQPSLKVLSMYARLLAVAVAALFVAGCNTMQGAGEDIKASGQAVKRAFSKPDFDKADHDRDGTLDRQEAQVLSSDVAQNFDTIDADKDGTVSEAEVKAFQDR